MREEAEFLTTECTEGTEREHGRAKAFLALSGLRALVVKICFLDRDALEGGEGPLGLGGFAGDFVEGLDLGLTE